MIKFNVIHLAGHHGGFFGQNGWLGHLGGGRPVGGFGHGGGCKVFLNVTLPLERFR